MTTWGLLAPKGWGITAWIVGALIPVLANIHFSNTITSGSIIVSCFVIVLAGVFTLRNNLRSFWKGLAEERAEQIVSLEEHLKERNAQIEALQKETKESLMAFAEEQRIVRHELKNQLAAAQASLQVEQAKTDLSALAGQLSSLANQLAEQHLEAMGKIVEGLKMQESILQLVTNGGD